MKTLSLSLSLLLPLSLLAASNVNPPSNIGGYAPDIRVFMQSQNASNGMVNGLSILPSWVYTLTSTNATDWTLFVIPDTQYLGAYDSNSYQLLIRYITNYPGPKVVLHVGDVVDSPTVAQFTNAFYALKQMTNQGIPHLICAGNHDIVSPRDLTLFTNYFSRTYYTNQSWWHGGFMTNGSTDSAYLLWTNAGRPYLFLTLELFPRTNAMAWAAGILATYPNHTTFVATHAYLDTNAVRMVDGSTWGRDSYGVYGDGASGESMWQYLVKKYPNVAAIFSGHVLYGDTRSLGAGDDGNAVLQCLVNMQMEGYSTNWPGSAVLRVGTVKQDRDLLSFTTLNPVLVTTLTGPTNQFNFSIAGSQVDRTERIRFADGTEQNTAAGTTNVSYTTNVANTGLSYGGLDSGLVLYVPFKEETGTNVQDLVTASWGTNQPFNNGILVGTNSAEIQAGLFDHSLYFSSNFVLFPSHANWTGLTNLTVSFWVKATNSSTTPVLVSKHTSGTNGEFFVQFSTASTILATFINSSQVRYNTYWTLPQANYWDSSAGNWHHVVVVLGNTNVSAFWDASPLTSTNASVTTPLYASTNVLEIASYSGLDGNVNFRGWIDEVKLWNRALASNEVSVLFNSVALGNSLANKTLPLNGTVTAANISSANPGYVMDFFSGSAENPINSTRYYGFDQQGTSGLCATVQLQAPKGGTINRWVLWERQAAGGGTEAVNYYLRMNDSSNVAQITLALDLSPGYVQTNVACSVPIAQGDNLAIQIVYPTWTNSPTSVRNKSHVYIE